MGSLSKRIRSIKNFPIKNGRHFPSSRLVCVRERVSIRKRESDREGVHERERSRDEQHSPTSIKSTDSNWSLIGVRVPCTIKVL